MSLLVVLVALIAVLSICGVAGVAIVLHFRGQHRKRELEHIERLRAFELGRSLPQDVPWLSPTKIGASIAIAVPIVGFVTALLSLSDGFHEEVWLAACSVGVTAVISGSVLVGFALKKDAGPSVDKPMVEEDAYDVVSSRG